MILALSQTPLIGMDVLLTRDDAKAGSQTRLRLLREPALEARPRGSCKHHVTLPHRSNQARTALRCDDLVLQDENMTMAEDERML